LRLFFDTSAFIKRYVDEPGSDRVQELISSAGELGLSVLLLPESVSTLSRLLREGRMTGEEYRALKDAILSDLADADICDLTPSVLERTVTCLETGALRALDAVHIGSALEYRPALFVSADRRQIEVAVAQGLTVEDLSR
jgi:predicted nucleic acid-binding protein